MAFEDGKAQAAVRAFPLLLLFIALYSAAGRFTALSAAPAFSLAKKYYFICTVNGCL